MPFSLLTALLPSLTFAQWVTLASALASALPEIEALYHKLEPALKKVFDALAAGHSVATAAASGQQYYESRGLPHHGGHNDV